MHQYGYLLIAEITVMICSRVMLIHNGVSTKVVRLMRKKARRNSSTVDTLARIFVKNY